MSGGVPSSSSKDAPLEAASSAAQTACALTTSVGSAEPASAGHDSSAHLDPVKKGDDPTPCSPLVATLMDFGIAENAALRAVHFSGYKTVDAAMDWFAAHAEDADINDAFVIPSSSVPAHTALAAPAGLAAGGPIQLSPGAQFDWSQLFGAGVNSVPHKMVLCVRTDLGMGAGKIAAQCAHAAVGLYSSLRDRKPEALLPWEEQGQPKVVLKVKSYEDMLALEARAAAAGLPTEIIHDAGRTQVAAGSATVLGIGPGPIQTIDDITRHLKLL